MKQSQKSLSGLVYALSAGVLGVLAPSLAFAGAGTVALQPTGVTGTASFSTIVNSVFKIILFIAAAAAIIYLIWSGVMYITAGGDDEKATSARKGIINAIIGIVVVVGAYYIFKASSNLGGEIGNSASTPGGALTL